MARNLNWAKRHSQEFKDYVRQRKQHLFGAATLEEIEAKVSNYIKWIATPLENSVDDLLDELG